MLRKIFKWSTLVILTVLLLGFLSGVVFLYTSPEFGGVANYSDLERFKKSKQYKGDVFINQTPTSMDIDLSSVPGLLWDFIKGNEHSQPKSKLEIIKTDSAMVATPKLSARVLWYGHSTILLQIEGMNVVLDPMMGLVPAPSKYLGTKRYSRELPLEIKKMPEIDAVIISHDHYDHLDYGSVVRIKGKTKHFYCPLGVGLHLKRWGVAADKIHELDWWDTAHLGKLSFVLTPSRHFSGRGITDRFKTLWGSWVVKGSQENIYFSGDGGYGPHFKEIGQKYGPFDLAFLECGQYNEKWAQIHMMPEQAAQAGVDLQAKVIMPIHWGAFTLALHSWTDPVERIITAASQLNLPVATPQIGELVRLDSLVNRKEEWWHSIE